jgi:hypothetical protein
LFVLLLACLAVVTASCGSSERISTPRVVPNSRAAKVEQNWLREIRSRAAAYPRQHFANPAPAVFATRLKLVASRYHFKVVKVRILHARQAAPFVVVETSNRQALSSATSSILKLIDPKARTNDDRTGWAYEGFLFEARDSKGVPFLATFNFWRGPSGGGGQWASEESLYPFAHG